MTRPSTIGARLERDRLEHRAARLQGVVAVLRERAADARRAGGRPARGLSLALGDFDRELRAVRSHLHTSQERDR
jgi:hypothetical protein